MYQTAGERERERAASLENRSNRDMSSTRFSFLAPFLWNGYCLFPSFSKETSKFCSNFNESLLFYEIRLQLLVLVVNCFYHFWLPVKPLVVGMFMGWVGLVRGLLKLIPFSYSAKSSWSAWNQAKTQPI